MTRTHSLNPENAEANDQERPLIPYLTSIDQQLNQLLSPTARSAKYEWVTMIASVLISLAGDPFYYIGNEDALWYDKASSIASNTLINFFVSKVSIDYLTDLFKSKQYRKAVVVMFVALALYAPQVLISISESQFSRMITILSAVATGLSGAFISAYGVSQMSTLFGNAKSAITQEWPYFMRHFLGNRCELIEKIPDEIVEQEQAKSNVLDNLQLLLTRIQATTCYRGIDSLEFQTIDELLESCIGIAKESRDPMISHTQNLFFSVLKFSLQLAMIVTVNYPLFAYVCDTDRSLRQNFHFGAVWSALLANVLMSYYFVMGISGGANLVNTASNLVSMWNHCRLMSNDMLIAGAWAAPAAVVIASFSGAPTYKFAGSCESSILKPVVTFPYYRNVMDYSCRVFNAIYTGMALMWLARYFKPSGIKICGDFCGEQTDNDFLLLSDALQKLINMARETPANQMSTLLRKWQTAGEIVQERAVENYVASLPLSRDAFFARHIMRELPVDVNERTALIA